MSTKERYEYLRGISSNEASLVRVKEENLANMLICSIWEMHEEAENVSKRNKGECFKLDITQDIAGSSGLIRYYRTEADVMMLIEFLEERFREEFSKVGIIARIIWQEVKGLGRIFNLNVAKVS